MCGVWKVSVGVICCSFLFLQERQRKLEEIVSKNKELLVSDS